MTSGPTGSSAAVKLLLEGCDGRSLDKEYVFPNTAFPREPRLYFTLWGTQEILSTEASGSSISPWIYPHEPPPVYKEHHSSACFYSFLASVPDRFILPVMGSARPGAIFDLDV